VARKLEEIESEVMSLDPLVRATLAKRLLESLDDLTEDEIEELWSEEAEARYRDFKAGKTAAISGDGVFARARARKL
jgi:putative addiction module component (TIGR02574 family)